jgi:O-acetylserine/cysteine efflux transporter
VQIAIVGAGGFSSMRGRDIGAAVLITAIWGVNFSVIKLGLQNVDPFVMAALRFLLCAVPAVFFIKKPAVPFHFLVVYGLLFGVGLWGVVNLSIVAGLSAGIASLLLQISALFTLILGAIVFRESITPWQWGGLAIAGVGLLSTVLITDGSVTPLGVVLVLIAAMSWSVANIVMKKAHPEHVLAFLLWSSLFAPVPLLALDVTFHGLDGLRALPGQLDGMTILSILFQVYPVTILGYWVWNSLLKRYPVSAVAPLSLLVPVFGLAGSMLIFHEAVPAAKIIALALVVGGVVVGLYGPRVVAAVGVRTGHGTSSRPDHSRVG